MMAIMRRVKARVAQYSRELAALEAMSVGDVRVFPTTNQRAAENMRPTVKRGARNIGIAVKCSVEPEGLGLRVERIS